MVEFGMFQSKSSLQILPMLVATKSYYLIPSLHDFSQLFVDKRNTLQAYLTQTITNSSAF